MLLSLSQLELPPHVFIAFLTYLRILTQFENQANTFLGIQIRWKIQIPHKQEFSIVKIINFSYFLGQLLLEIFKNYLPNNFVILKSKPWLNRVTGPTITAPASYLHIFALIQFLK